MGRFHLAQVNIARMRAPLTDPLMADFAARIAEINAIAEAMPGFVWRWQEDPDQAASIQPFDDATLFNLSVWTSVEALIEFSYRTPHKELVQARQKWFAAPEGPYLALWWIPAGTRPSVEDSVARLEHLRVHGETPHAFTFRKRFAPDENLVSGGR